MSVISLKSFSLINEILHVSLSTWKSTKLKVKYIIRISYNFQISSCSTFMYLVCNAKETLLFTISILTKKRSSTDRLQHFFFFTFFYDVMLCDVLQLLSSSEDPWKTDLRIGDSFCRGKYKYILNPSLIGI